MRLEQKARGGKACAHPQRVRGQPARRGASVRCRVLSPPREEAEAVVRSSPEPSTSVDINVVRRPVSADMEQLVENLLNVVGNRHPMLMAAAQQIFGAGGKKLRPMLVFLVARATTKHMNGGDDITQRHRRLAEITEMIHTASLVHDDVLDECDTRRGKETVNSMYGTRVAVLAGDFLFAESSAGLANLDNLEVIKLISQVIADFANGEISQATALFDTSVTIEAYLEKSFFKTASLIAASCRSAAVFSDCDEATKQAMFDYGKHLGLAFQVVDDILDFTQTAEQLGKPRFQDIASGNLTAPTLFAMRRCPELVELVEGEFLEDGALDRAVHLIESNGGYEAAKALARKEGDAALAALRDLPVCDERRSLESMVDYVLERIY